MSKGIKICFTEEQEEFIKESLRNGFNIKQISKTLNVTDRYVSNYCINNGLHYFLERWNEKEDEIIKSTLNLTCKQIQNKYIEYRTDRAIDGRRKKLGLKAELHSRFWSDEDTKDFIEKYPNYSYLELFEIFPDLTKIELQYMARKYSLYQTKEKELNRRRSNGLKTNNNKNFDKIKENLIFEINSLGIYQALFNFFDQNKFYSRNKIFKFLLNNLIIKNEELYKFSSLYYPYHLYIDNFDKAKYIYDMAFDLNIPIGFNFSKEHTVELFKYWCEKNNFSLEKEYLLNKKEFRSVFQKSKLEQSIRKHYEYTYNFIQEFIPDEIIYPWMTGIQVPNKYWDNKHNVYKMIDYGILRLHKDNLIENDIDILFLDKRILKKYFTITILHKRVRPTFIEYFNNKGIKVNCDKFNILGDIQFDSGEELSIYLYIKNLGFQIEKCSKKNKYHNDKYNENYIPDFFIYVNNKKYIVEYFGMYDELKSNEISRKYFLKTNRKIEFFELRFPFISLFPDDLDNGYSGIYNKLQKIKENENFL